MTSSVLDTVILGLSLNGKAEAKIAPGWPSVLELSVLRAQAGVEATIEVRTADGHLVNWKWRRLEALNGLEHVGALEKATLIWALEPAFSTSIPPSLYEITVRIGEDGDVSRVKLEITEPPSNPTPTEQFEELRCFVQYDRLRADFATALERLDQWLAAHPSDYRALVWRAELLEELERKVEALRAWSHATQQVRKSDVAYLQKAEDLLSMRRHRDRLARSLLRNANQASL